MADNVERNIENINREIKDLIASLRTLKAEFQNAEKASISSSAGMGGNNQILKALDVKRQALLKEQERLHQTGAISDPNTFTVKYPPDVEARINKITEAVKRLNEAELKLRGMRQEGLSGRTEKIDPDVTISQIAQGNSKLTELLAERRRILSGSSATAGGVNIPTPAGPAPSPTVTNPGKAAAELEAAANAANISINKRTKALGEQTVAEKRAAERAAALAKEEQHLAEARAKFQNEAVYANARLQAEARGFKPEDLRAIEDRGGGIQRLRFSRQEGGINQQFNPYVNTKTGVSTPGLSSQFRTFGSDILRDIGQFTKWSIAIAAVYTPMQKLGELITIMIDNESRFADATIAANVPFSKSGEIFDTVAVSANQAGESINTTIDAYTSAIRAAGRYNDEATKQVAAVKLLDDALVLSKLSTLNQAESIDVLSAALLQSDRSLVQGEELLNKWVRVSQVANVSIDALATGVAVLGDSAETVGLSVDQLNGLIAVLSEQSISGAKEAANTAKALVGAYQSDKAEAALNKYGIALRKTNGEVRGFLDIYQELAKLRSQGVLSEAAVSEVALALGGGGVRRAKDASALINSTDRLNKIAAESAKVTGADSLAQDQLAKKLETVQTANTRLANSFQELAQTLGTDGGLLDSFKTLVNLLTGVTRGANELFSLLGRSGPLLATFVTGILAVNSLSGGTRNTLLAQLGATGGGFKGFLGGAAQYGGINTSGLGAGKGALANILQMNYKGAGLIGGAGVALQAGTNLAAGRNENAIGNVAGGAVGAAIGAALGGPIGLAAGANIGSAIGDAFVTAVDEHSADLADYFVPKNAPRAGTQTTEQPTYRGKTTQELLDTAYEGLGFFGKMKAFFAATVGPGINNYGGKKESAGLDIVKSQNPALYQELVRQYAQQEAQLKAQTAVSKAETGGNATGIIKQRELEATQARQYQLGQLAQGKITTAEFGRVSSQLSGFPAVSVKSVSAFGDEITKVSKDIKNTSDAYDAFLYIAQYGTQDQINLISSYSDDILKLQTYLKELEKNPSLIGTEFELSWGKIKIESPEQLRKLILDAQKQGSTALGVTLGQVQASQAQAVKLPPLVGDYNKPLTGKSQDIVVQRGLAIQEKYLQETGKTAEEMAKFKAGIEAFYATVDRGSGANFEAVNGLTQQFYDLGKAAAEAAGELENINQPIGFQKFDQPIGVLQNLAQQSLAIGGNWQKKFNYDFKPEDQIAIDNQGIVQPLHADFKILALLLEKLNEKAQKQLDGQYNIPEGATFWVPLTAAYYRNKGGTGTNDLMQGLDLGENTNATDANTQALRELTAKYEASDFKIREQQGLPYPQDTKKMQYENLLRDNRTALPNQNIVKNQQYQQLMREYGGEILPQYRNTTAQQSQVTGLLQELKNFFQGLFSAAGPYVPPGLSASQRSQVGGGVHGQTGTPTANQPIKLDLRTQSNINLLVDGRVLASTIQSYLASELLATQQAGSSITKRYVI